MPTSDNLFAKESTKIEENIALHSDITALSSTTADWRGPRVPIIIRRFYLSNRHLYILAGIQLTVNANC